MSDGDSTLTDLIVRVRAEYGEMPGLSLSRRQVQRQHSRFLRRTTAGTYVIADRVH